jgi:MYXO-CTERM domain-containing protein
MHTKFLVSCVCTVLALALLTSPALGALSATATVTTSDTSGPFNYTISLQNTGTTPIGTLWFAWDSLGPSYNFLTPAQAPTNIVVPTGWIGFVSGPAFAGDGRGLEMYNIGPAADLIPAGGNATFSFTSTASPTDLLGNAPFLPFDKVSTSFVYAGFPQAPGDPGFKFNPSVSTVPEPASFVLGGLGGLIGLLAWRRRRPASA